MAEETQNQQGAEEAEAPAKKEQKIMCFVSKQMVPLSETVEIEYAPRKKVRVMPQFVKYGDESAEA